jgi:CSLREA domain-containing protein
MKLEPTTPKPTIRRDPMRKALYAAAAVVTTLALTPAVAGAATITPSTNTDENGGGADCSLREAIEAAGINADFGGCTTGAEVIGAYGADTIQLAGGPFNITQVGNGDPPNLTGDLDVGAGSLTIRGSSGQVSISMPGNILLDRVFDLTATGTLTLENLSIGAGDVSSLGATLGRGGAIRSASDNSVLSLTNVEMQSNNAVHGGGVYVGGNGSQLHVTDSEITENLATQSGGGISLVQGPTATITRSSITFNDAESDSNVIGVTGGGISALGGGVGVSVTVTDSEFVENETTDDEAAASNDAQGGAISVTDGDLTVRRSFFGADPTQSGDGNSVEAAGVNDAFGGAISFEGGADDDALIANTTLFDNSADAPGAGLSAGGAIYNASNQTEVDLNHVTFSGNDATDAINGDHIHSVGGAVTYTASIIPAGGAVNACEGTGFVSGGSNALNPDDACLANGPNDTNGGIIGIVAGGPQDNGGLTRTIALGASGTALDREASCATAEGSDQRGYPRPFNGGACDAGAYERIVCSNGSLLNGPGAFPGCPGPATPQTPAPAVPKAKKCKRKKKGKKGASAAAKCKRKKKKGKR